MLTIPSAAVIVAVVLAVTFEWVTLKVAVVFPAVNVTLAGTTADFDELLSVTEKDAGAGLDRVIVPVTEVVALPLTEVGETDTDTSVGAVTANVATCELVPREAVTDAFTSVLVATVLTGTDAFDAPTAKLTDAGTVTDFELETSLTKIAPLPVPG